MCDSERRRVGTAKSRNERRGGQVYEGEVSLRLGFLTLPAWRSRQPNTLKICWVGILTGLRIINGGELLEGEYCAGCWRGNRRNQTRATARKHAQRRTAGAV